MNVRLFATTLLVALDNDRELPPTQFIPLFNGLSF